MKEKKLLLVESEMTEAKGHYLDYLIETSFYFMSERKIIWFLNKNFKTKNIQLPEFCLIKKIIKSNFFHIKKNRSLYFLEEIFIFIKSLGNIFFFTIFFLKSKRKLFNFYKTLYKNYFILPKYFKSFYLNYLKYNFNSNDDIIFQSCRRKDLSLIYFLSCIENKNLPKIHVRVFHLPNKRFKGFYFYIKLMKNQITKGKIFLYTEKGFKYNYLKNDFDNDIPLNHTKPIITFYKRQNIIKNHIIGFVGEARVNKGFNRIPEFIKKINQLHENIDFIVHATNINNSTNQSYNEILRLSSIHKNINITNKYHNYREYRKLLSRITIMPLLYDSDQIKIGSAVLYSCISNEIIPIFPKNSDYLNDILVDGSFLTANDIDDFCFKTSTIIGNYKNFLSKIKISSSYLKKSIDKDPLITNILS